MGASVPAPPCGSLWNLMVDFIITQEEPQEELLQSTWVLKVAGYKPRDSEDTKTRSCLPASCMAGFAQQRQKKRESLTTSCLHSMGARNRFRNILFLFHRGWLPSRSLGWNKEYPCSRDFWPMICFEPKARIGHVGTTFYCVCISCVHGPKPMDCSQPWDFSGENTGVSCHFLLQGIFLTRDQTCISCVSGIERRILYPRATWEARLPSSILINGHMPGSV